MARRNNDVKFDWDNNTIIFNLRFSKESKIPGTPEFKRKLNLKQNIQNSHSSQSLQ